MSFGWLNETNNKPFNLKVGDKVRAPYIFELDGKRYVRDFVYTVTKIYPHIFQAKATSPFIHPVRRDRTFRKADYVCGYCRRA